MEGRGHGAVADAAREHERFLWGLCYRMTGVAADADDLVQETYARALASPPEHQESLRPCGVESRDPTALYFMCEFGGASAMIPVTSSRSSFESTISEPQGASATGIRNRYSFVSLASWTAGGSGALPAR